MDRKPISNAKSRPKNTGLQIITRNNKLYLSGTIRIGGESVRVREATGIDRRRAGAQEEAELYKIKRQKEIVDELLHGKTPDIPFAAVAYRYLEKNRPGAADVRNVEELYQFFGNTPISRITADKIDKFYLKRFPSHAASTIRRHQNTLSAILTQALKMKALRALPYFEKATVPSKKGAHLRKKFLPGEIEFMIDHLPAHGKPIVATLYCTGARVGQTLWLSISDFILAKSRGRVYFPETKNGHAYDVALHDYAVDTILEWLQLRDDDYDEMFLTPKKEPYIKRQGTGGQIKEIFDNGRDRLVEHLLASGNENRAKIVSRATPHWLRHNFANTMRDAGSDVTDIKEAGMWESSKVVEDYYMTNTPKRVEDQVRGLDFGTKLTQREYAAIKTLNKSDS